LISGVAAFLTAIAAYGLLAYSLQELQSHGFKYIKIDVFLYAVTAGAIYMTYRLLKRSLGNPSS